MVDRDLVEVEDQNEDLVEDEDENEEPSFFADPKRIAQTLVVVLAPRRRDLRPPAEARRHPGGGREAGRRQSDLGRRSRWRSPCSCSSRTWRCSGASSGSASCTSNGASRTRSRWPGWRPHGCSRPGGAGGIVLTYWALRKAGMPRRQTACRMVAFLVLLYAVYMVALVVFGVLLAHRGAQRRQPGRPDDRAGRDRRGGDRRLPADRPDPGGRRASPRVLLGGVPAQALGAAARERPLRPWRAAPGPRSPSSANPSRGGMAVARSGRFLGGQHRHPLGVVSRLRRPRPARRRGRRASSSAWSPTCSRSPRAG